MQRLPRSVPRHRQGRKFSPGRGTIFKLTHYPRFSHMSLFVQYRDQPLWQAVRDAENPISHNADHTYWVFHAPFDPASLRSD